MTDFWMAAEVERFLICCQDRRIKDIGEVPDSANPTAVVGNERSPLNMTQQKHQRKMYSIELVSMWPDSRKGGNFGEDLT